MMKMTFGLCVWACASAGLTGDRSAADANNAALPHVLSVSIIVVMMSSYDLIRPPLAEISLRFRFFQQVHAGANRASRTTVFVKLLSAGNWT
jgi:hypothetical protein